MFKGFARRSAVVGCLVAFAGFLAVACESDASSNGESGNGGGQITSTWSDYCTATFTEDVAITDVFGDAAFTAHVGEEYLLTEFGSFGGETRVQIAYLTAAGPETLEVPITAGSNELPFTSNCTLDDAVEYYAVFTDVTVYDSEDLSHEICQLAAGTAVPRDMSTNTGFSTSSLSFSGPTTYEIMLNALGDRCGGADLGYVSVPSTQLFGTTTWLVPIAVILKPE